MNSWVQMGVNSNGEEVEINETDESNHEIGQINYKQQYIQLKKKLKLLLFVSEECSFGLKSNLNQLNCVLFFRRMNSFKKTFDRTKRDYSNFPETAVIFLTGF